MALAARRAADGGRAVVVMAGRREFCYFVTFALAWPSADQSGSGQLVSFVEQFIDLTT
jgi:hypothetical protein